jgi:hypothetical protein
MVPVEHTRISSGAQPISVASDSDIAAAFVKPSDPVAAFAQPEFTTIPLLRWFRRRLARLAWTGAAAA